jgi:hypothetical protein
MARMPAARTAPGFKWIGKAARRRVLAPRQREHVAAVTLVVLMGTEQQIAALVAAYIDAHPTARRHWRGGLTWLGARPTTEELGATLLADAESQALALGGLLRTPEGQVIAVGVGMVIPPGYALDFKLFVEALTWASREQQRVGRDRAGKFALVAVAVIALFAILGE